MKAEAMSLRKSRCAPVLPVCHDAEIMAPLKHDCLFPLTTPTCQWVGHAAPETAPRLQPLACVHEYAQGLPKLGHHRGRNATPDTQCMRLHDSYYHRFVEYQRFEQKTVSRPIYGDVKM